MYKQGVNQLSIVSISWVTFKNKHWIIIVDYQWLSMNDAEFDTVLCSTVLCLITGKAYMSCISLILIMSELMAEGWLSVLWDKQWGVQLVKAADEMSWWRDEMQQGWSPVDMNWVCISMNIKRADGLKDVIECGWWLP